MPSRPPPSSPPIHHVHHRHLLLPLLTVTITLAFISLLSFLIFLYRKLSYNRTTPFDHHHSSATATPTTTPTTPTTATNTKKNNNNRFSYSAIRRATGSFSASNRLGHGGFGSVYKATLPSGQSLAVKLMDSTGSLQGEREFHNELSIALNLTNPHILSLHGFSTDRRGRKLLLVYELMPNRSLQEALLDRSVRSCLVWKKRFSVDLGQERKKRKIINSSLTRSIDWWLDGLGGEIRSGRRNSQDWGSTCGGDVPKSGGISSTPSMRGTVCYVAPEYGGGGQLSEKCDVYSFGVLVLVLISGRRPLQVTASPMSEFERANLISWARQLARNGKLLDLVDQSIHSLDKEEALLCITIALLCLQRTPGKRPTMKEIVGILLGEAEPPHLPFEFSPSPPSNFPFKSRKKAR
ncbi:LOW QUALITY PROTEIN: receptor-like serine/threonine-protein kinase At2g45590 [Prunus persica]|uniref:LOW QUALITY PROTEIN: receptor-like serine/threonine-protein kinase At2g45590 n=1 Tax=Prunus persica TaxID=3760 RepID=UPI0009AB6D7A|nr:LOW QUALITY PROTEIN: receptor-like serine/threonine-protein kinase At2g45590 [Prunus persica]